MEHEEPIYRGILQLPVGKLLKKSWQQKYCSLFKSSKFGVERLEVYDTPNSKEYSKIIILQQCIKVYPKSNTTFVITTKTNSYEFNTLTEHSNTEWVSAIQSVAFPDDVSKITTVEEDNDLYCSSGEGVFNVKLHPSPVSIRCGLENKNYTLVLMSNALQLRNVVDDKLLFTWPYHYIRRYGYKNGRFTFEAGRKCESGEGIFYLEHPNQQEIFRCLASKMKCMKKLASAENSPLLDGDAQFQAAFFMEPRSRTPLVPSSTLQSLTDLSVSSKSQISISSSDSDSKYVQCSLKTPETKMAHKLKPSKPPRKFKPVNKPEPEYEPVQKYDEIEFRNNAWQTLGVDSPDHKEQHVDEEDYMSWGDVRKEIETVKKPLVSAIITENTPGYYDKLNFFGSTSKLNTKSPYKQVYPVPVASVVVEPPSFNDYDEVQCFPEKNADEKVNHQFHNEEAYAVISKPKRV
ncbi:docking protein 2 [Diorhabda carinulata]|uniref:docking protein 2 n=1 Tax=Diorhabda carinulata TaxID=1163345 RepID=UPI0025A30C1E|nr:docking protein 2 [Diorhabda carinulata]